MNIFNDNNPPEDQTPKKTRFGWIDRSLFKLLGVDRELMEQSPEHDANTVRALGGLAISTALFQAMEMSLISHRLFARPGQLRPELLAGSLSLAIFILLIDAYIMFRTGFELDGLAQLRRGGLEIEGPPPANKYAYLVARLVLSVGFAQLSALFMAIIIFGADIDAKILDTYQRANATLRHEVTSIVDTAIDRATAAEKAQENRVEAKATQVATLQQHDIDPASSDPQVQQAEQEVARLLDRKAKSDDAAQEAENFAVLEKGGVTVDGRSSGVSGRGPRYRAAMEAAENAKKRAQDDNTALDDSRKRLETLRVSHASSGEAARQRSQTELPGYRADLTAEEEKLAALKKQLDGLVKGRSEAIQRGMEAAPNYVPMNNGFLGQIQALERIAKEDPKIATVILLIDMVSFGLELAAVLAKACSFVPMVYSALLARRSYAAAVRIVDELADELNKSDGVTPPDSIASSTPVPANENEPDEEGTTESDPFTSTNGTLTVQPRRGRGRPRKQPRLN